MADHLGAHTSNQLILPDLVVGLLVLRPLEIAEIERSRHQIGVVLLEISLVEGEICLLISGIPDRSRNLELIQGLLLPVLVKTLLSRLKVSLDHWLIHRILWIEKGAAILGVGLKDSATKSDCHSVLGVSDRQNKKVLTIVLNIRLQPSKHLRLIIGAKHAVKCLLRALLLVHLDLLRGENLVSNCLLLGLSVCGAVHDDIYSQI